MIFGKEQSCRLGLGQNMLDYVKKPEIINIKTNLKGVAIGVDHCLAWDDEGYVYGWGSN